MLEIALDIICQFQKTVDTKIDFDCFIFNKYSAKMKIKTKKVLNIVLFVWRRERGECVKKSCLWQVFSKRTGETTTWESRKIKKNTRLGVLWRRERGDCVNKYATIGIF